MRSSDVKNGSLLRTDFKGGQLPQGAPGKTGPQGEVAYRTSLGFSVS